jgi:hypothetical protein
MREQVELEGGTVFSRIKNLDLDRDPVRFSISDQDENEWFGHAGLRWRW